MTENSCATGADRGSLKGISPRPVLGEVAALAVRKVHQMFVYFW
jgi:hypothetical protein